MNVRNRRKSLGMAGNGSQRDGTDRGEEGRTAGSQAATPPGRQLFVINWTQSHRVGMERLLVQDFFDFVVQITLSNFIRFCIATCFELNLLNIPQSSLNECVQRFCVANHGAALWTLFQLDAGAIVVVRAGIDRIRLRFHPFNQSNDFDDVLAIL